MNPLRAEFDAVLAQYRRDLPSRIAALDALLAAGRLEELKRALHTLAGSAGTFGLPQVSEAAHAAEESLGRTDSEFTAHFARLKELGTRLAATG